MKTLLGLLILALVGFNVKGQNNSELEICPILVGTELPQAEVTTLEGEPIQILKLVDDQPTVIVVYRGGWCPYCTNQMKGLAMAEEELREMGYQILAISPDNPEHLRETMGEYELPYQLLSDSKLSFIDAIGVGFNVDGRTLARYEKYGIDLVAASGEQHKRLPVPTVLVLNRDTEVTFVYANPNYRVRLDEEVLLAAAKAALKK